MRRNLTDLCRSQRRKRRRAPVKHRAREHSISSKLTEYRMSERQVARMGLIRYSRQRVDHLTRPHPLIGPRPNVGLFPRVSTGTEERPISPLCRRLPGHRPSRYTHGSCTVRMAPLLEPYITPSYVPSAARQHSTLSRAIHCSS